MKTAFLVRQVVQLTVEATGSEEFFFIFFIVTCKTVSLI